MSTERCRFCGRETEHPVVNYDGRRFCSANCSVGEWLYWHAHDLLRRVPPYFLQHHSHSNPYQRKEADHETVTADTH